tara:strand:- start:207 stop:566 length:360 start_codon:yes stop_codon:yes gene_type:complete
MNINYSEVLPKVITAMFPKNEERELIIKKLEDYGKEDWQIEPERVRLAILKLSYDNPGKFNDMVECACGDYRDVLYFAETPLSGEDWDLPEDDPKKYQELMKTDKRNYLSWIDDLIKKG